MSLCFGYGSQIVGQPPVGDLEEPLRAEAARSFPGDQWGGLFSDESHDRRKSFGARPAGFELNLQLRSGDAILFGELYQPFRLHRDLQANLKLWAWRGVQVVALDVDLTDDEAIEVWRRSLQRRWAMETIALNRSRGCAAGATRRGFTSRGPAGRRKIVPDLYELAMMREAARLFGQGLSRYQVARRMMLDGWKSPRTRQEWSDKTCIRNARAYLELVRQGIVPPLADIAISGT